MSVVCAVSAVIALLAGAPQDPGGANLTAITGARVHTASGPVLEPGTVLIEGGKIKAVGRDLEIPAGAEVIHAAGRTIIPGLVDCGSVLFVPTSEGAAPGAANHDVLDALDAFTGDREEHLSAGITTVLVHPTGRGVFNGLCAILRLLPGTDLPGSAVRRRAALKMTLGYSGGDTANAAQRIAEFKTANQAFVSAREYKEGWDKYRKELAEYEPRKKQWGEQQKAKEGAKSKGKDEDSKMPADPKVDATELKEEPRKPRKPPLDPRNEALVLALDGKIPVHIEVHAAASIEHALTLAAEFKLKVVLECATESARVLEKLSKSGIPVLAGPLFRYGIPRVDFLRHSPSSVVALERGGVPFAIGSFPIPGAGHRGAGAGRFLLDAAALAVGEGLAPDRALRAVTLDAARILGIENLVGSLEPGKLADLVILTGDPFSPATRVDSTLLAGRICYQAAAETK